MRRLLAIDRRFGSEPSLGCPLFLGCRVAAKGEVGGRYTTPHGRVGFRRASLPLTGSTPMRRRFRFACRHGPKERLIDTRHRRILPPWAAVPFWGRSRRRSPCVNGSATYQTEACSQSDPATPRRTSRLNDKCSTWRSKSADKREHSHSWTDSSTATDWRTEPGCSSGLTDSAPPGIPSQRGRSCRHSRPEPPPDQPLAVVRRMRARTDRRVGPKRKPHPRKQGTRNWGPRRDSTRACWGDSGWENKRARSLRPPNRSLDRSREKRRVHRPPVRHRETEQGIRRPAHSPASTHPADRSSAYSAGRPEALGRPRSGPTTASSRRLRRGIGLPPDRRSKVDSTGFGPCTVARPQRKPARHPPKELRKSCSRRRWPNSVADSPGAGAATRPVHPRRAAVTQTRILPAGRSWVRAGRRWGEHTPVGCACRSGANPRPQLPPHPIDCPAEDRSLTGTWWAPKSEQWDRRCLGSSNRPRPWQPFDRLPAVRKSGTKSGPSPIAGPRGRRVGVREPRAAGPGGDRGCVGHGPAGGGLPRAPGGRGDLARHRHGRPGPVRPRGRGHVRPRPRLPFYRTPLVFVIVELFSAA